MELVTCKLCGKSMRCFGKHFQTQHNMTWKEYKKNVDPDAVFGYNGNPEHRFKSGKDNPAYGHGGKFSPFSKNFIKADKNNPDAIAKKTFEKVKKTKAEHPERQTTRIEYWLERTNGDLEEAQKLLSERQSTFSLKKCIEKYGEDEGRRVWQERQDKWQNTLNSKSEDEIKEINLKKVGDKISSYEKELVKYFELMFKKENVSTQFFLAKNNRHWIFDFKLFDDILIEFNGDYWHMNPEMYNESDFNQHKQKTAKEIWEYDKQKREDAESIGYKVFTIWEQDFINNGVFNTLKELREKYAI